MLLGRVEGEIADVEGSRVGERVDLCLLGAVLAVGTLVIVVVSAPVLMKEEGTLLDGKAC